MLLTDRFIICPRLTNCNIDILYCNKLFKLCHPYFDKICNTKIAICISVQNNAIISTFVRFIRKER